jgi:hypothetical protein
MKSKLLVTVAAAALIVGTTLAFAQQDEHGGTAKPGGAMEHAQQAPGGAMGHAQSPSGSGPANKGLSQTEEHGNTMQRGAQENQPGKAGVNAQEHAQTQERSKTEENAQTQERTKTQENAQTPDSTRTQQNAQTQERGGQTQQNAAETRAANGKSVQLSETQRAQVKDIIVRNRDVARVDHPDFNVSVGVTIPRTIHVAVLPEDIVTVVPEYRGFDYVVVGDQFLIIDPQSLEVVAILPV